MKQITQQTEELLSITHDILREAKRLGADQAEISVAANKGFAVRARNGDVETIEYHQDKHIEVTVFFGKRMGTASITDIRPESYKAAVDAACHIAKFTDEDPASGLAEKNELAFDYPKLELAFPWDISVEKAIELACQCEREAKAYDKRIMSVDDAHVGTMTAINIYANSHGFIGHFPHTRHEISCVAVASGDDEMQRDYSYTIAANPIQLTSVVEVAKEAAKRTIGRLDSRPLKTTKAPVIFAAEEARSLFGHLLAAISGGNLYRKSSFLVDHLDKKIFPEFVHLQEHPHLIDGLGSAPFDDDGVATRANVFIDDGVLRSYVLGVYSARKLGMQSTGNAGGIHNLIVKTGNKDLAALIKAMHKGLLVTDMMGNAVNLLTGDYSRGVGGFWIENGEIQFPVSEITIAGKLPEMFGQIKEIGNDVDLRGNVRTGSVLIEQMTIAGS